MSGIQIMKEIFTHWRGYTGELNAELGSKSLKLKVLATPEEQENGFMGLPEPDDGFGLYFKYNEPQPYKLKGASALLLQKSI